MALLLIFGLAESSFLPYFVDICHSMTRTYDCYWLRYVTFRKSNITIKYAYNWFEWPKVKSGKYKMPNHVSPLAKDLITKILVVDPKERFKVRLKERVFSAIKSVCTYRTGTDGRHTVPFMVYRREILQLVPSSSTTDAWWHWNASEKLLTGGWQDNGDLESAVEWFIKGRDYGRSFKWRVSIL